MKHNFVPMSATPASMPILRWYVPPVVRSYEQISKILVERGEVERGEVEHREVERGEMVQRGDKHATPSKVKRVCDAVSRKLRMALQLSR